MSGSADRLHPLRGALLELPDLPRLSEEIRAVLQVDYEPDVVFFSKPRAQAFTRDQSEFPVPDLVVEVASIFDPPKAQAAALRLAR